MLCYTDGECGIVCYLAKNVEQWGFSVIHSLYKLFDQKLEFDIASFKLEYSSAKWVRFLVCKNWFIETKSVSGFRLMNLGTRWLG